MKIVAKQLPGDYYSTVPNESNCFVSIKHPNKKDRKIIFQFLDSLGYYDHEKFQTVFQLSKNEMYFLSLPSDYNEFKELIPHFKNIKGNVLILFKEGNEFYHYWAAVQDQKENFGQMKYIGYRLRYAELDNAKNKFCYDYIFGDDPVLVGSFYNKKEIDTVYYSKAFYLAKLIKSSCDRVIIND